MEAQDPCQSRQRGGSVVPGPEVVEAIHLWLGQKREDGRQRTRMDLALLSGLGESTIKKILNREPVRLETLHRVCETVDFKLRPKHYAKVLVPPDDPPHETTEQAFGAHGQEEVPGAAENTAPPLPPKASNAGPAALPSRRAFLLTSMGVGGLAFGGGYLAARLDIPDEYEQQTQKAHFIMGERSEAAIREAGELYEAARQREPKRPQAYLGLATSLSLLRYYGYEPNYHYDPASGRKSSIALEADKVGSWLRKAEQYSRNDELALCQFYTLRAWVNLLRWEMNNSGSDFDIALLHENNLPARDPHSPASQYATLHQWYSLFLIIKNQRTSDFYESFTEIGRAEGIAPKEPVIPKSLAQRFYYAKAYETALKKLSALVGKEADNPLVHYWLGLAYEQLALQHRHSLPENRKTEQDYFTQARNHLAYASNANQFGHEDYNMLGAYIHACAISGDLKTAQPQWDNLKSRREAWTTWEAQGQKVAPPPSYVSPAALSIAAIGLYDATHQPTWRDKAFDYLRDKALGYLEDAEQEYCSDMLFLSLEPRYESLRKEPRFVQLQNRMSRVWA
ncbi:MAG TPA: helix-turn-helix transcriptional regulator [Chthonomonadaceae bacterium]|nr:helix-turn-helix transcriptional regulator [Chthonomonadaceae bacterium]